MRFLSQRTNHSVETVNRRLYCKKRCDPDQKETMKCCNDLAKTKLIYQALLENMSFWVGEFFQINPLKSIFFFFLYWNIDISENKTYLLCCPSKPRIVCTMKTVDDSRVPLETLFIGLYHHSKVLRGFWGVPVSLFLFLVLNFFLFYCYKTSNSFLTEVIVIYQKE